MTSDPSHRPGSALRQRMIGDMSVRGFSESMTTRTWPPAARRIIATHAPVAAAA